MYLKRLKDLREDSDLTQTAVAAYLHCDQSLYSKYELCKRHVPLDTANALAEFFDVDINYLIGNISKRRPFQRD